MPQKWSDDFVKELEKHNVDLDYFVYRGDDHNFAQGNWSTVVNRNIEFYRKALK